MVIYLNDYSFFPRGLPFSHFWNLTLTISVNKMIISCNYYVVKSLTSLSRSLLGISSQSLADRSGSDGGVLDIAGNERNCN